MRLPTNAVASGGPTVPKIFWSEAALYQAADVAGAVTVEGNYTLGTHFIPTRAGDTLTGVKFYWPLAGGSKTIKASAWDHAGTRLQTIDVAVTAGGFYTATFSAAIALTAFNVYSVSIWVKDGSGLSGVSHANYGTIVGAATATFTPSNDGTNLACGFMAGEAFSRIGSYFSGSTGDHFNDTADTVEVYGVEPVFAAV